MCGEYEGCDQENGEDNSGGMTRSYHLLLLIKIHLQFFGELGVLGVFGHTLGNTGESQHFTGGSDISIEA
jgi:hypothetical protein